MKDKILVFIIGFLVGTIITAGGFFIYSKLNNNKVGGPPEMMQNSENRFKGGRQENFKMEDNNKENIQGEVNEIKPEENNEERPELPSSKNQNSDKQKNNI